jgi:hypothetical protein
LLVVDVDGRNLVLAVKFLQGAGINPFVCLLGQSELVGAFFHSLRKPAGKFGNDKHSQVR